MERVYLALGGNVGDVVDNMRQALQALDEENSVECRAVSPVYRTPPWGQEDQDWFHNACALLRTNLSPQEFLNLCLETERNLKRVRKDVWGPRTIDLDILVFGDHHIKTEALTIPHPRMLERAFVLKPLADIAPELVIDAKPVSYWLNKQDSSQIDLLPLPPDWWKQG